MNKTIGEVTRHKSGKIISGNREIYFPNIYTLVKVEIKQNNYFFVVTSEKHSCKNEKCLNLKCSSDHPDERYLCLGEECYKDGYKFGIYISNYLAIEELVIRPVTYSKISKSKSCEGPEFCKNPENCNFGLKCLYRHEPNYLAKYLFDNDSQVKNISEKNISEKNISNHNSSNNNDFIKIFHFSFDDTHGGYTIETIAKECCVDQKQLSTFIKKEYGANNFVEFNRFLYSISRSKKKLKTFLEDFTAKQNIDTQIMEIINSNGFKNMNDFKKYCIQKGYKEVDLLKNVDSESLRILISNLIIVEDYGFKNYGEYLNFCADKGIAMKPEIFQERYGKKYNLFEEELKEFRGC